MAKVILLNSLRSMQNVGAIFRNADGSGFSKLYLTWYTPFPPRNEISKTALWWEKVIDWEYFKDPIQVVSQLKEEWYKIVSVELTDESQDYRKLFHETHENICLILWNEVTGVDKKLLDLSDEIVMIPMLGTKESLNVSVAAGIVMYATV